MTRLRARLSYANVMATIAVFVALGGTAYAGSQLNSGDIQNNSLTGADIKDNTLKSPDIATNAVTGTDVAPNAVTGIDIAEQTLGTVPDAAGVAGNEVDSSNLIKLSAGQEKPLLTQGSLELSAFCGPNGAAAAVPFLIARSKSPGEFHFGTPFGSFPPANGEVRVPLGAQSSGAWATTPYSLANSAGDRAFGIVGGGRDVFGSACVVTVFQLG